MYQFQMIAWSLLNILQDPEFVAWGENVIAWSMRVAGLVILGVGLYLLATDRGDGSQLTRWLLNVSLALGLLIFAVGDFWKGPDDSLIVGFVTFVLSVVLGISQGGEEQGYLTQMKVVALSMRFQFETFLNQVPLLMHLA